MVVSFCSRATLLLFLCSALQIATVADKLVFLRTLDTEGQWQTIGARVAISLVMQIPFPKSNLTQFSALVCDENDIGGLHSDSFLMPCSSRAPGSYIKYTARSTLSSADDSFIVQFIAGALSQRPQRRAEGDPANMKEESFELFRATHVPVPHAELSDGDSRFLLYVPRRVLSALPWEDAETILAPSVTPALRWSAAAQAWLRSAAISQNILADSVVESGGGGGACWRQSAAELHLDLTTCRGKPPRTRTSVSARSSGTAPAAP